MKWILVVLTAVISLGFGDERSAFSDKEDIVKTLAFPAGGSTKEVVVDNISGSIRVVGYDGNDLQLVAHRRSFGDSEAKLQESKRKITLDITQEPGRIVLFVNTPWRCRDGSGYHGGSDDYGFDAEFDFELKVPSKTDCTLKTVNGGSITVADVSGEFNVRNVNGGIAMTGISGAGSAKTVNGNVSVAFHENPHAGCGFATVNGSIDITLTRDLSADLRFKTFNGEVFSDFDLAGLPHQAPARNRIGKRTVYRSDEYSLVRAGRGGPQLEFETLNGDIRVLKDHQ